MPRLINLTGQTFGRLTVIEQSGRVDGQALWSCLCSCGNRTTVRGSLIRRGETQSCGCLQKERVSQARLLDLTNSRFGRWKVLSQSGRTATQGVIWRCQCDCGNIGDVAGGSLTSGDSKSCGCFRDSKAKVVPLVHGMARTPTGTCWLHMLARCYKEHHKSYAHYGGRGIRVCEFLRTSPVNLIMVIGIRPTARHTLDREDNDGSYTCGQCAECFANGWPKNIRWATRKQQMRNTRKTRKITLNGRTQSVDDWADELGVSKGSLLWKYFKKT